MKPRVDQRILADYARAPHRRQTFGERLFWLILLAFLGAFTGLGLYFTTIEAPAPATPKAASRAIRTSFVMDTPRTPPEPPPDEKQPAPDEKAKQQPPIDLTETPEPARPAKDPQPPAADKKKVRRVYGLKKVYSRGIGAGGDMSDAVIGKLGNTLAKEFDTLVATREEIQGSVVSATTVDRAPRYIQAPRPRYNDAMRDAGVEGTVRVKALIDTDGLVKRAVALNDLGHGAARLAAEACLEARFEPAMRGGEPAAVWIIIPIRFELLD